MNQNSTETSVKSSYAVVYTLKDKAWVVSGEGGWSELHLCRDAADGTYRLLAWTTEGAEVLLNANITSDCGYKSKSMNFHCFTDENGVRYGLGFHKSDEAIRQADAFMEEVKRVIQECKKFEMQSGPQSAVAPRAPQASYQSTTLGPPASTQPVASPFAPATLTHSVSPRAPHQSHVHPANTHSQDHNRFRPNTSLPILPPKPKKGDVDVRNVIHVQHASYENGSFQGLPTEWETALNKNFGVAPRQLTQRVKLEHYSHPIPRVLVEMNNYLKGNGGYRQVGIFRKAPDSNECKAVKLELDKGNYDVRCDVHVMANLIKVWFRDLPIPILDTKGIDPQQIQRATNIQSASEVIQRFPGHERSIVLWLLDVCVEVANFEDDNKMTAQNLAIVIGPNLFNVNSYSDPMAAMGFSQKVVTFFQKCIDWRQQLHDQ